MLLAHTLGHNRAWLIAHADETLPVVLDTHFTDLAARRRKGEPVAYLIGRREFRGLELEIDPSVLIPRPETETLVEVALGKLPADRVSRVLDPGTGSGAVALAIAHERPLARVLATDRSKIALDVARRNAQRLGLANVAFARGDWYAALRTTKVGARGSPARTRLPALAQAVANAAPTFDVIVSNPPYVAEADPHLGKGDLRFEPRRALAAGPDGLDALRTIIGEALPFLVPGGWLAVEHGYDQADAVRALFDAAGFDEFTAVRDLAGIVRVAAGRRK